MHLLLFNPKSDQQEEGLKLHDSKDSPMAGHKTGGGGGGVVLLGPVHLPYWSKYLSRQCVL